MNSAKDGGVYEWLRPVLYMQCVTSMQLHFELLRKTRLGWRSGFSLASAGAAQ